MKTAIIGAGINGLYLAWKLAEKGEDVTVFEKREKIGKDVCSGLFSERILEFIPHLRGGAGFIPENQNLIQNKIESVLIHFPKKTAKIRFSRTFFVINHFGLDNLVANLAEKAGAKIILNHTVTDIPEGVNKIIGCDGALSKIRELLKMKNPDFYLGIQGIIEKEDFSTFVETWPTKLGFIWKIPRGREVEYGIMEKPENAKRYFDEFLNRNNIILQRINSSFISRGLIIPSNDKITLCGDAAGLTKPWSGGGVIWGLSAADILLKTFPDFSKYKRDCERFFLPKIIFSEIIKKMVYFSGFNFPRLLPKKVKIEGDFLI